MSSGHLKTADSHSFNKKRIFQNELEKYQELLNELESNNDSNKNLFFDFSPM